MTILNKNPTNQGLMISETISVLFIKHPSGTADTDPFEPGDGFIVQSGENKAWCEKIADRFHPDIVLVDPGPCVTMDAVQTWGAWLAEIPFFFQPGCFLVVDTVLSMEDKCRFRQCGFDDVIPRPVQKQALRYLSYPYLRHKILEQKNFTGRQTLKQAHKYLDRFKHTLSVVKKELIQEKTSLNNALKQLHHMNKERRHLKSQVQKAKQALAQNMAGCEKLLSQLIRTQIETSQGHGDRVAHIACFIGKDLGCDEKKLENIHKAGMLHEIGLVFMPRTAQKKPLDRWTAFEKNIQLQYPVKGADLLSYCQVFEKPAQIIRYMHENADGSGYPRGLKKDYIPLASRILAGADMFDTLKHREDILCLEDLMAALENLAGSRLDPQVVNGLEKYALLHMGSDSFQIREVGVDQLEPGMRLGCALFTAAGTKLFSADTVLTRTAIDKIIQYNREFPVDDILYIKV